jgi:AcrR family transcriptional regulator
MSTESTRRRYEQRARAEQQDLTRQRIAAATAELHATIGPARTTIAAIAQRAGVQRGTVYRHFPDEHALFTACAGHFRATSPPPDPSAWVAVADPDERLVAALDPIYAWFERVEPMLTNVLRDAESMPVLQEVSEPRRQYLAMVEDGLAAGWGARGRRARTVRAALGLALDFTAWRTLNRRELRRDEIVALMGATVRAAAHGRA